MLDNRSTCFDPVRGRMVRRRGEGGPVVLEVRSVGRYLPSGRPGHEGHELTQVVRESKVTRRHDRHLAGLLCSVIDRGASHVAAVPSRPGDDDRLGELRWWVASTLDAKDAPCLSQRFDVPGYRALSCQARRAIAGRFACEALPRGAEVLLIDDVLSSGGQVAAAANALLDAGARAVRVAVIARAV